MTDTSTASFYPNLCYAVKIRVLDQDPVHASNDAMAANFEIRHFIDLDYLASIDKEYLENLKDPTPPCQAVWGTRREGGERVVGMLGSRLTITLYTGIDKGWAQLKLQNVLVVESLPVPMHVSMKALELFPGNDVLSGESSVRFNPLAFPEQFRSHPYWYGDGRNPHIGTLSNQLTQKIIDNATGGRNKVRKGGACAACGLSYCTLECAKCNRETYCSRECQILRWKIHKKTSCKGSK